MESVPIVAMCRVVSLKRMGGRKSHCQNMMNYWRMSPCLVFERVIISPGHRVVPFWLTILVSFGRHLMTFIT